MGYEAVAGVLGTMINMFNDEMARENSNNQNRINREWQANQNELDRSWQSKLQQEQFERQAAWQENMWTKQNEYNSPLAQINRLQAAGINPVASLYGGSAGSAAGNSQSLPNAPNPSTPGSHGASGSATPVTYSNNTMAGLFSSLAQLKEADSRAGVSKAEKDRLVALTKPEVEAQHAAAQKDRAIAAQQQEQAAMTAITRSLAEKFGDDKAVAEINKLVSDSYENYAKGNYDKAQTELTRVTEEIARLDWSYKSESLPTLLTNLKLLGDVYRSEASRNYASASESYSQVSVNEKLRDLNHYKSLIEKDNWSVSNSTKEYVFDKIVNDARKSGIDVSLAEEELKHARTNNLFEAKERMLELINRLLDAYNKTRF